MRQRSCGAAHMAGIGNAYAAAADFRPLHPPDDSPVVTSACVHHVLKHQYFMLREVVILCLLQGECLLCK